MTKYRIVENNNGFYIVQMYKLLQGGWVNISYGGLPTNRSDNIDEAKLKLKGYIEKKEKSKLEPKIVYETKE